MSPSWFSNAQPCVYCCATPPTLPRVTFMAMAIRTRCCDKPASPQAEALVLPAPAPAAVASYDFPAMVAPAPPVAAVKSATEPCTWV